MHRQRVKVSVEAKGQGRGQRQRVGVEGAARRLQWVRKSSSQSYRNIDFSPPRCRCAWRGATEAKWGERAQDIHSECREGQAQKGREDKTETVQWHTTRKRERVVEDQDWRGRRRRRGRNTTSGDHFVVASRTSASLQGALLPAWPKDSGNRILGTSVPIGARVSGAPTMDNRRGVGVSLPGHVAGPTEQLSQIASKRMGHRSGGLLSGRHGRPPDPTRGKPFLRRRCVGTRHRANNPRWSGTYTKPLSTRSTRRPPGGRPLPPKRATIQASCGSGGRWRPNQPMFWNHMAKAARPGVHFVWRRQGRLVCQGFSDGKWNGNAAALQEDDGFFPVAPAKKLLRGCRS